MREVLVTGGAGFIGANFVHHLLREDPQLRIVTLDKLTYAGNRASLEGLSGAERHHFVEGDICDAVLVERVMREHAIDTVVHFAAESHVDRSIASPGAFVQTNVVGTYVLLEAARAAWHGGRSARGGAARFHHVSTDEVFGSLGPADPAFTETTRYDPRSPYSASKAASDHLVQAYAHTYGVPVTLSNCSNNYGPYQFPEKLIPLMIINTLYGRALPVYGDGQNVRDWLHVEDHCRGIELVLRRGVTGATYNIGGRNEWKNLDVCHTLCALVDAAFAAEPALATRFPGCPAASGRDCAGLIEFVRDRPGHDRRYAIDPTRIATELGYAPRYTFETGLRETVGWYLQHAAWWQPLLTGDYRAWIAQNYARRGEPAAP